MAVSFVYFLLSQTRTKTVTVLWTSPILLHKRGDLEDLADLEDLEDLDLEDPDLEDPDLADLADLRGAEQKWFWNFMIKNILLHETHPGAQVVTP